MKEVRNMDGKLVCRLHENGYLIEIVKKGCTTIIRFNPDSLPDIIQEKVKIKENCKTSIIN